MLYNLIKKILNPNYLFLFTIHIFNYYMEKILMNVLTKFYF